MSDPQRPPNRQALSDDSPRRVIRSRTAFGRRLSKWIQVKGYRTMQESADATGFSRDWLIKVRRGDVVPKAGSPSRRLLEDMIEGRVPPPGERVGARA